MPQRVASSAIVSCACFFVPTNRTVPPLADRSRAKTWASRNFFSVFYRSVM
jgi:hypothetical protein